MHTSVARIFITSFSSIVQHCTTLYFIVHHCTPLYSVLHPCTPLYVPHLSPSCSIVHHCIALNKIVLHRTVYNVVRWCTMVYTTLYNVHHYTTLYSIVHYIVPHLPPLSSSPTNCLPSQQPRAIDN